MQEPACGATISNMAISPSGDLIPCQSWLDGKSFGNLLESDFKDIWKNKELNKLKKEIIKLDFKCPLNIKEIENEKNNK